MKRKREKDVEIKSKSCIGRNIKMKSEEKDRDVKEGSPVQTKSKKRENKEKITRTR